MCGVEKEGLAMGNKFIDTLEVYWVLGKLECFPEWLSNVQSSRLSKDVEDIIQRRGGVFGKRIIGKEVKA